jgi:hypothetical protein
MSNNNTGGPAFPSFDYIAQNGKKNPEGMTLRDYFAAKAIHAFSISPWDDYAEMESFTREEYARYCNSVAESAYEFADAMLKARQ